MKDAMRAKDSVRLSVIRGIVATCTNEAISKGRGPQGELTDDETLAVVRREAKKHKDSIGQYEAGGRPELAESEQAELVILETFLPSQMSVNEIRPVVEAKIKALGVTDKASAGKLTGAVMKELTGRADGALVKQVVESLLS